MTSRHAFTLVESLAILALLAMVVALVAANLGKTARHAAQHSAVDGFLDADARARLLGRRGESVRLVWDDSSIRLLDGQSSESILRREVPPGVSIQCRRNGVPMPIPSIGIDAAGRSADYTIHLTFDDDQPVHVASVAGLTGAVWLTKETP